jgi:hypothetical protein
MLINMMMMMKTMDMEWMMMKMIKICRLIIVLLFTKELDKNIRKLKITKIRVK